MHHPATPASPSVSLTPDSLVAFQALPVPILVADTDGKIVMTNQALDVLFEYPPGALHGELVELLLPPSAAAGHRELREAYAEIPYPRTMGLGRDLRGVTRTGRVVAVEIGLNTIDLGGTRHVLASVHNVGPLRSEQDKTRLAFDAASTAMIMVDDSGRIVMVNQQTTQMFGYPDDALLGQPIETLVPAQFQRRHAVYRQSYTAAPSKRAMGGGRSLHGQRADGSEFPVEIGLTPVEDDRRFFVMATVMDITDRIAAEKEIRRQNDDLLRLNGELAQFAYSASHDLKAPLATLDGLLVCLEDDLDVSDLAGARQSAARARELAGRLAALIEGILGFARAEHQEDVVEEIAVFDLVRQLVGDLESSFRSGDVELLNTIDRDLVLVTDPVRLAQVMENLLTNAAKFAHPGRPDRMITVAAEQVVGEVVIHVRDNGIGIPEADRGDVFTMFRRCRNHSVEGSGLGLAMVKQHVEHLGGAIDFESGDAGTTFSVTLPSSSPSHSSSPTPSLAATGAGAPDQEKARPYDDPHQRPPRR